MRNMQGRKAERIHGEVAWTSRKQLHVSAVQVFGAYSHGSWQSSCLAAGGMGLGGSSVQK